MWPHLCVESQAAALTAEGRRVAEGAEGGEWVMFGEQVMLKEHRQLQAPG